MQPLLEQNSYLYRVQAEGKSGSFAKGRGSLFFGRGSLEGQIIANLLPLAFSELKKVIFSHSIAYLFI